LSHWIPIGLVCVFISLGLHDLVQDAWKNWTAKSRPDPQQVEVEKGKKRMRPIPAPPVNKRLIYKSSDKPVEPDRQPSE
jgi:hypothetical protein